ncbi:prepilin peptidase CpaA [Paenibacillus cellulosilyticus]|uniref:Prepilin peptidase CpaA n=1 Tax=Paenibacillus cellulosilyticus TaxID=375489 RepID=A0A2V2YTA4_9BACL|nr:A24 family peptidase [Paenibacillus cellulosilyticus]PWW02489.1 prepilin peptidase CpaA [Paenibacillus cellulosilyticus]QKS47195.1 prepilin peptidase [Paenibacillus cellulosilyticus]
MIAYWGASVLIACALLTDVRSMRIPNVLCAGAFAAALLYGVIASGGHGLLVSIIGAAAGFVPMLAMYAVRGIGAGDVKLFGALGAWLGTQQVLNLMMYSILYAGAIGLLLLAVCRLWAWPERLLNRESSTNQDNVKKRRSPVRFPFMIAVAPAAVTCWYMIWL